MVHSLLIEQFSDDIRFPLNLWSMQSEDEREMCARTVYCTNIDKKVCRIVILRGIISWQKLYVQV